MLMAWSGKFSPNKVWSFYTLTFHRTLDMVNSSMGTLVQTGHTLEDNLYCAKVIKRNRCWYEWWNCSMKKATSCPTGLSAASSAFVCVLPRTPSSQPRWENIWIKLALPRVCSTNIIDLLPKVGSVVQPVELNQNQLETPCLFALNGKYIYQHK